MSSCKYRARVTHRVILSLCHSDTRPQKSRRIKQEKQNEEKNEEDRLISLNERKKDLKEKNLVLNLDIEKINFEINSKKNDLSSLKNLKVQIKKSIDFQQEILDQIY